MIREDHKSISFPVMRVQQPIGDFFIGSIPARDLFDIAYFDIRKLVHEDGIDDYLGIQRELSRSRLREIRQYVKGPDATFPTAVILSIPDECASLRPIDCEGAAAELFFELTLANAPDLEDDNGQPILYKQIARVIDGQHRIAGLEKYHGPAFEINVAIFIGLDISDQANVFATVNLAQTKVNKSLVYDLLALSKARTPERVCHNVAVVLDKLEGSPFFKRIKRLGKATEGRLNETLSQATVVQGILQHICKNRDQIMEDRNIGKINGKWMKPGREEADRTVLRLHFVEGRDEDIVDLLWNYFSAVAQRWPDAWNASGRGRMLNKTNGYNALMRFFGPAYRDLAGPGEMISQAKFYTLFNRVKLDDDDFTPDRFLPGSTGATELYRLLLEQSGVKA